MADVLPGGSQTIIEAPIICRHFHRSHPPGIFYGDNPLDYSFTVMLLELTFIILITRTIRFLLKPLKQPRIVSEIIGGIIIGPSVLGRNEKFATHLFPDNATYAFKNIGLIGFVFFLFLAGVKIDVTSIFKTGKKQLSIALFGVMVPFIIVFSLGIAIRSSLDKPLAKGSILGGVASAFTITTFPVLHQIVKELNLLSSEVGRLALSTVILSDVVGINCMTGFEAAREGEMEALNALWYVISVVMIVVCIFGVRQAMLWIVRTTPEGKPVEESYVVAIFVLVMVVAFASDASGAALANAPLWLGLAVPEGPPLGTTLVDKAETFVTEIFMPFSYAFVGMYTDVSSLSGQWSSLGPLFAMAMVAYVSKFVTILIVCRFFDLPLRDSLALSLVMSLRGQVEILIFIHWMDIQIVGLPSFTMLVLLTTLLTAIATPLISILYDPSRPYMVNKRRAIQYTPQNTKLHIVACIHDQESVAGFINLLQVSNPTLSSPFSVYALRLIDLAGRGAPVFIDHQNQAHAFEHTSYNPIHNALRLFEVSRNEYINFHLFTSVSPMRTMYQDICELAMSKKATLIILPFQKECLETQTEVVQDGASLLYSINTNVLSHAPCSVGILVDKESFRSTNVAECSMRRDRSSTQSRHHFSVLFLGGADAREALAYADRMAGNPDVTLTVVRFLSFNGEGDNGLEKKLDDGLVTWFWVKNEGNERVIYREVVVKNGEETLAAIQAMNEIHCFDLWIVGRKQGINPMLTQGLTTWNKNQELGVIGEYVASVDLGGTASVLVMQQQVLRGQDGGTSKGTGLLGRLYSGCIH